MMLKVAVVVLVLALISDCEAGRRAGRRREGGRQRGQGNRRATKGLPPGAELISSWQRTLVERQAQEFAFTLPGMDDQIYVTSKDRSNLKQENYKPSKTLYDFTGGTSVVMLKVKKMRGCIKLDRPMDLTKDGVIAELQALNNTVLPASTPVNIYLTDDTLDATEASAMAARPGVSTMCGRKPIKVASATAPLSMEGTTTVLTTTVGEQLSITATGGRGGRRRGGGGGRRGGRRNGDGRRGNRGSSPAM